MASIEVRNLVKQYPGAAAPTIRNADLVFNDKEFIVLVGPSGCGKSTLLRMIAGLEDITSGDLLIDNQRVNEVSPKDRDISMVFQNYALYPHMSVYDNMAFGLQLRKVPKDEIDKKVKNAARILGIEHLLDRKPKDMSGGQRQRVAIGRSIVREPKVFLFDEPLSNLDAKLRVQMRTEIKRLHRQLDATMVYVTHDQIEAMTMGDRIVIMKDGIIQQFDTPMNLFNDPINKFVAGFIGSPSMNFLEGEIIRENGLLGFKSKNVLFGIPDPHQAKLAGHVGKAVTFGFRPEYVYDKAVEFTRHLSQDVDITIDVVEPIGSESFNYFHFNGNPEPTFCFRTSTNTLYKPGQVITIGTDIERLRFFDESGERIA
ncbi:ABC transporter ATP-binding protein [Spirosoma montaniterrae]|uniref:Glycerol-3-phosphate ABC transporter ATP-binding protein n=1 Tax=Spirosoma montaniterrae TaxID=1178516 RepID=A0A1P9WXJ4_9BACT|nr:sn-glycerol-3-phosphate ABC transporter ATP-binding protein UgpC [Spirosoma montaniterrae]AQG80079.1 glycerol-3-phosphate ABC transporter ATP-binding protein [Spirosoma montaniterrae]